MKHWYVLYTHMHKEQSVAAVLQERELEIYCPMIPSKSANSLKTHQPFFPCYVFLHANMDELNTTKWQWVAGIKKVVSLNGKPAQVPEQAIAFVQTQLKAYIEQLQQTTTNFKHGEVVRIKEGPFENLYALFDKSCTPSDRVQVLLDFLGKANKVKLSPTQIEKAPHISLDNSEKRRRRTRGGGRKIKFKKDAGAT